MKTIKIDLNRITDREIDLIVKYLMQGKVIVYPTDTIYGLGCLAISKSLISKVHRIKNQERKKPRKKKTKKIHKPLLVLISNLAMAEKYCYVNKKQIKYLKSVWPGPVTAVLKLNKKLPKNLTGGLDSLAVRLPKSDFLIKIIKKVGAPIVSTSLNVVGGKPLASVKNLDKYFKKEKPDLVVDAGVKKGKPSVIVDIRDMDNIKIIRK